jgi:hypothetical protein
VSEYLETLPFGPDELHLMSTSDWINSYLAPVSAREQRVYFDRKTGTHELKLVPHWTAAYCPYPNELCDCSEQGTTKIGFFDTDGTYYARPGFEEIEPTVFPS